MTRVSDNLLLLSYCPAYLVNNSAMVKLDVSLLRYLSNEDFRVLTAVEMGMKNHELVPASLVSSISSLKHGGVAKILHELTRKKLLSYERGKRFDGYRLTYHGYDFLALNVLRNRDVISQVGNQIGVGKESDVFIVSNEDDVRYALKVHRLGRTCFRGVTQKRDYTNPNTKVSNWIYMSRLAAVREFQFMKILHEEGFSVPQPIDCNRHCVVMGLISGTLLNQVTADMLTDAEKLYRDLIDMILSLANDYGVVHGDFNEFNIMIKDETNEPVLIDFPQMVATNHRFAREYFDRDVKGIVDFFKRRFNIVYNEVPAFDKDVIVGEEKAKSLINMTDEELEESLEKLNVKSSVDSQEAASADYDPTPDFSQGPELSMEEKPPLDLGVAADQETEDERLETGSLFSVMSKSTSAPDDIKNRLKKEKIKEAKRNALKVSSKSVKGESNAVRRNGGKTC